MLSLARPLRAAIFASNAKCSEGSSSSGGIAISPTTSSPSPRHSATNASVPSGATPALLRLLAGVDLDEAGQSAPLAVHLPGQRLREPRPVQGLDHIEQGHRLLRLVGLNRADHVQPQVRVALAPRGPARQRLLDVVLAEGALACLERCADARLRLRLAGRDQGHRGRIAIDAARRRRDPLPNRQQVRRHLVLRKIGVLSDRQAHASFLPPSRMSVHEPGAAAQRRCGGWEEIDAHAGLQLRRDHGAARRRALPRRVRGEEAAASQGQPGQVRRGHDLCQARRHPEPGDHLVAELAAAGARQEADPDGELLRCCRRPRRRPGDAPGPRQGAGVPEARRHADRQRHRSPEPRHDRVRARHGAGARRHGAGQSLPVVAPPAGLRGAFRHPRRLRRARRGHQDLARLRGPRRRPDRARHVQELRPGASRQGQGRAAHGRAHGAGRHPLSAARPVSRRASPTRAGRCTSRSASPIRSGSMS